MIIYNSLKHSKIEACAVLTTQATSLTENYKEMYMETALANLDSRYYGVACEHFIWSQTNILLLFFSCYNRSQY